jgi:hypothetical protein
LNLENGVEKQEEIVKNEEIKNDNKQGDHFFHAKPMTRPATSWGGGIVR